MATKNYIVNTRTYTKVADNNQDCVIQNKSPYPIRVVFTSQFPSIDETAYRVVEPRNTKKGTVEHTISRFNGIPEGNVYVCCGGPDLFDRTSEITVTTGEREEADISNSLNIICAELRLLNARFELAFDTKLNINDIEDC